jgi:hypothetical protein
MSVKRGLLVAVSIEGLNHASTPRVRCHDLTGILSMMISEHIGRFVVLTGLYHDWVRLLHYHTLRMLLGRTELLRFVRIRQYHSLVLRMVLSGMFVNLGSTGAILVKH